MIHSLLPLAALLATTLVPAQVRGPSWFIASLVYGRTFDTPAPAAEVCDSAITGGNGQLALAPGFLGQGAAAAGTLVLQGPPLSPHRPCTISFWWSLEKDLPIDGGFQLFSLNGKGFVSAFTSGKGEWCALQKPAGVLQVYYLQGIQNVNGIYDYDLARSLDLHGGVWHHCAVVFQQASVVELYTDGKLAYAIPLTGRSFAESDALVRLEIGGAVRFDEVAVLNRAIDRDLLGEYLQGMWRLREYTVPGR